MGNVPGQALDLPGVLVQLPGCRAGASTVFAVPLVVVRDVGLVDAEAELSRRGWVARGRRWARFEQGTSRRLDVVTVGRLGLAEDELHRVCAGWPLEGELLVRGLAGAHPGPPVPAAHRAALHGLLAADPGAWLRAFRRAEEHGRGEQVVALQDAYESGLPLRSAPGSLPVAAPAPVVALSGLDGAGKTTQAHLLAVALHAAGLDAAVEWSRLGVSSALQRVTGPLRRITGSGGGGGPSAGWDAGGTGRRPEPSEVGARRDVHRSPLVDGPWSLLVSGADAADARRTQRRHVAAGRVVVRDRYLLDSLVHVADRYGAGVVTAPAQALLAARMPPAACALLLELPAAQAYARKPGEWSLPQLERHAAAYDRQARRLGIDQVDATLSPLELAACIASHVWPRLP